MQLHCMVARQLGCLHAGQIKRAFNASHPVSDIMMVTKVWRRGYYAAVSYVDHNIGKALDQNKDICVIV